MVVTRLPAQSLPFHTYMARAQRVKGRVDHESAIFVCLGIMRPTPEQVSVNLGREFSLQWEILNSSGIQRLINYSVYIQQPSWGCVYCAI